MKHDIQLRLVSIAFRGSLNFLRIRCWYRAFPTVMLENSTRFEYNLIPMIVLLENATYCLTLPRFLLLYVSISPKKAHYRSFHIFLRFKRFSDRIAELL